MSTSTLDLTDLEHLLDAEPACENDDCDNVATLRLRFFCGCGRVACGECTRATIDQIANAVLRRTHVTHRPCQRVCREPDRLSDVVEVRAL